MIVNNNLHFRQSNITSIKLILFLVISIFFLIIDNKLELSNKVRENASYLISPIYKIAEVPVEIYYNIKTHIESKNSLIKKNESLEKKIFIQSGIIQKIPSLKEENKRLKKLLNSSNSAMSSKILIAELIKVNLSPFSNKIVLDKGSENNIFVGQVVIDSLGILGQVSEVNNDFSVATLITDPGHALLAVNARTEKRIVISGTGDNRFLKAKFISLNEDVMEGDILITSGLDNIFPEGYMIGQISKINKNLQEDFLEVNVTPSSSLSSNREVMLLW
ncbi:MAG: rod shape-determining protein MreC [Gammaproteobacteria bacterium]|nr:rod shape-determining protein MreC [Gammaproteobacteria bacterium]|tara:strand:+ start:5956 stop:6783 length:828 start_codon:yes stop_codon:yes gene_type:complete